MLVHTCKKKWRIAMLSMLYIKLPTDLNILEREEHEYAQMLTCNGRYTFRNGIRWKQVVYILWMKHVTLKCEILTKYITYLRYHLRYTYAGVSIISVNTISILTAAFLPFLSTFLVIVNSEVRTNWQFSKEMIC